MKIKRILSIFLAAVMLLCLAACNIKGNNTKGPSSDNSQTYSVFTDLVEENKISKKFKTEDGSVYFKLDLVLPSFDTEKVRENAAFSINAAFDDILNEAIEYAENNVTEVLRAREREGDKKLYWERTCTFTVTGESESCISFLLEYTYSTQSGENSSVYHQALVFGLESGEIKELADFSTLQEYQVRSRFATRILAVIDATVTPDNEEPRYFDNITEPYLFDRILPKNFYFSPEGVTVFFDRGLVSPDYRGTAFFTFTYEEISDILDSLPDFG